MSVSVMEVAPESQRLIAVSLGKIAASRSQKGGINLHKNLLVATVLHKARTAYMVQQYHRQRAAAAAAAQGEPQDNQPTYVNPIATTTTTTSPSENTTTTENVEMREESTGPLSSETCDSEKEKFHAAPLTGPLAPTSQPAFPGGAEVSSVQLSLSEDKENSPPSSPSPSVPEGGVVTVPNTISPECQARLHGGDSKPDSTPDSTHNSPSRAQPVSHSQNTSTRDYVRSSSSSCSSCVLKRRRLTDNENVSAPKVRILEEKVNMDTKKSGGEPMMCDSPQISSLVNIFNTSFANGLAGNCATQTQAGSEATVRTVVTHLSASMSTHKLTDNLTCAKEMSMGGASLVRQPLVLSV